MEARQQEYDAALEQAMEWFVLLQDDPDDSDLRRRVEAWIAESAANAAAWSATARTSSLAESLLPFDAREWAVDGAVPDKSQLRIRAFPHPGASGLRGFALGDLVRRSGLRILWTAGGVSLACLILFLAAPAVLIRLQADHVTGTAEARDIVLSDGTTVTLAPGSALAVAFAPAQRGVTLLSGEAFFAVKPDASRPFVVSARDVRATVIGTAFDVRLDPLSTEIAVNEGRVKVDSRGVEEVLSVGESLRLSGDGAFRSNVEANGIAAWRGGVLVLDNRSLDSAVAELERYLPGRIIISDRALGSRPVTGVFDLKNPERGLRGVAAVLDAKVQQITPWVYVVSPRH